MPAPTSPTVGDPVVSPDMISSANGMTAKPPNWSSVPNQMYGTRFQPRIERWLSDLWPINARSGANTSGSETISATSHDATWSSTIITRLRVPISITAAMPTVTWNSDRRNRRLSGSSADAASAKGRRFVPIRVQNFPFGAVWSASSSIGGRPGSWCAPAERIADAVTGAPVRSAWLL